MNYLKWPVERVAARWIGGMLLTVAMLSPIAQGDSAATTRASSTDESPLPTGRSIGGSGPISSQGVGSMPLTVVLTPDGRYAVTTDAGFRQAICSVRVSDGVLVSRVEFRRGRLDAAGRANGLYWGLTFGSDGRLYAAMGAAKKVAVFSVDADGKLNRAKDIDFKPHDFPAGLAADALGRIYVTQNDPMMSEPEDELADKPPVKAEAFGTPASVCVCDSATGGELGRYVFEDDLGLSNFPLAVAVNRDGSRLYVGSERDDAVYVLDASNPKSISLRAKLSTGSHPLALLLNREQSRLFVANAQSDTVSIVDTVAGKITGTVLVRPQVARDLAGATPTGLALSPDETTLYATLGDMNAVAVIHLDQSGGGAVGGLIPVGWYPTSVAVAGSQLLVTNAKGDRSRVPHDFSKGKSVTSPLNLFEGTLWRLPMPSGAELAGLSEKCLSNARLTPHLLNGENPLRDISRKSGKIQHVIYVVKENRTYDQVLGDVAQGNGDPARCLFPREITPNLHALATRFVLLDNFYDSGEVSGDGWTWSTQAQANDYTVRNVPYEYSNRGRTFDFEGTNNDYPTGGFPATSSDGTPLSEDPRFEHGGRPVPDVGGSAGGHLWDLARKHGISYRNYGFFLTNGVDDGGKTVIPDNFPSVAGLQPGGHDLVGISDIDFRRFDLTYPDSEALARHASSSGDASFLWPTQAYGRSGATSRFSEWKREFDLMLAKDPSGGAVPNLMTVRFCTDHTSGAKSRKPTPRCMVADNDFAVGELVEAVSHSPIWKSCAIVVVEDDAQNGPDHVDAHRSTCYVISPWMKKGTVDHSFQNTVSALRTIECLLDLPPMCQYDAASGVIGNWATAANNDEPFTAMLPPAAIMKERNPDFANDSSPPSPESPHQRAATEPARAPRTENRRLNSPRDLAAASGEMDFSKADEAPAELLNRVIWKTVRGADSEMPPTPHGMMRVDVKGVKDDD